MNASYSMKNVEYKTIDEYFRNGIDIIPTLFSFSTNELFASDCLSLHQKEENFVFPKSDERSESFDRK